MAGVRIKNGGTERIDLTQPFKGFIFTFHAVSDTPITNTFKSLMHMAFDLDKIYLTLRHVQSGVNVFRMPFSRIWAVTNIENTTEIITSLVYPQQFEPYDGTSPAIKTGTYGWNIPLDTYVGEYEFIFEMNEGVRNGWKIGSWVSVIPEWSTDAQSTISVYNDLTLERQNTDVNFGSGIDQVVLLPKDITILGNNANVLKLADEMTPLLGIKGMSHVSPIIRFSYSSKENSESYVVEEMLSFSQSLHEIEYMYNLYNAMQGNHFNPPFVFLHHGEILSDFRLSVEQSSSNTAGVVVYKKIYNDLNADYNIIKQDAILDGALNNIQNL